MLTVKRNFPLRSIASGAMLGNGKTGLLLWGGKNQLNITLGCAELWDHRGGLEWTPKQNFHDIFAALKNRDEDRIKDIFAANQPGNIKRPSLIPVGRLVVTLPENSELLRYEQRIRSGLTRIVYSMDQQEKYLDFHADMTMHDVAACSGINPGISLRLIPAWDLCKGAYSEFHISEHGTLAERGFDPPQSFSFKKGEGFLQPMPADPPFAMIYRRDESGFTIGFRRGMIDVGQELKRLPDFETIQKTSRKWWSDFWRDVPSVSCGDRELEELYWHGLYKYGIMTNPDGVTPGLQGPWIEDDHLPPWQGDYHFNINIQMCHMPGFKAGKFRNLRQMFDLVLSWKEKLRHNARCFVGIANGYMLPHAVDDRGVCMGSFWTGTIDHACSAWIAMMMFDYCNYSGDIEYLRTQVYDFMSGVMHVYEAMMEKAPDGTFRLPLSVSPEYRGSQMNAWGQNASFQLAAIHGLIQSLTQAAEILHVQPETAWAEIGRKLPKASLLNGEIAVWDGTLLEESHRHHSHLAGICPFDSIDPTAEEWEKIIAASVERWIRLGMGEWTGWCIPWAAQIHIRLGNGNMAELLLKIWKDCFTNAGGGSLHDGRYKGYTIYSDFRGEIMQMDGCMGAVTAIQDRFLFCQNGVLRIFYGFTQDAQNISFKRMFAPGGLRISGRIDPGGTVRIKAEAQREVLLRVQTRSSRIFEREMKAGEVMNMIQKKDILIPV